jgi:integrase
MEDGQITRRHFAKQIEPVAPEHERLKHPPKHIVERAAAMLQPINRHSYAPNTVTRMGEFVNRVYLPHVAQQKRASTYQGYRNKWRLYFQGRCDWWLRDVRTCDVQHLLEDIARQHNLSRATLRHIKALLSGIFNFAKQQGYFDGINPVIGVAIPKARSGRETVAYSLEEVTRMIMLLPEPAATIVATAAFSGLRRGELRGLWWDDYTGEELHVTRSVWNSIADEPKTEKSKAPVPTISHLRKMLDAHRLASGNPVSGPIFVNTLGKPVCLNNLANRIIIPVLRKAGIEWHGWHAFRRGLATNLNRMGVPGKTIQSILRHSNLSTTMNVYVKSVDEDSRKAMNSLDALMCAKRALAGTTTSLSRLN